MGIAPVVILKNIKNIQVTVTTAKGIIGSVKSMLPKRNKLVSKKEYQIERAEYLVEEVLHLLKSHKNADTKVFSDLAINSLKIALYNVKKLK